MALPHNQLLEDMQALMGGMLTKLEESLPAANEQLALNVADFIGSLDKTNGGKLIVSSANLKKVAAFRSVLSKVLAKSFYYKAVQKFVQELDEVSGLINLYFSEITNKFSKGKEMYQAVLEASVDTTVDSLVATGLDANFREPVLKALKQNVTSGATVSNVRKSMNELIAGTEEVQPLLTRYVNQVSNDAVHQYSASYLSAVSADLGLSHYFYQGTVVDDSRSFCAARAGKYFTEAEVKGWAGLEWAGKAKGTNPQTIFLLRGGYNCRHVLIPVSKELYERETAK